MNSTRQQEQAVDVLQSLGLKEYEAKSFVALTRTPKATAREISELSDIPRTRVYDATRVLEAMGLIEVQHSNPQQFRAVPIDEAVDSLESRYESRVETLQQALEGIDPAEEGSEPKTQEVWALSGSDTIATRTRRLVENGTDEVVLVVGDEAVLTEELCEVLTDVPDDIDVVVGTLTEDLQERVRQDVPNARVFVSGLEWLHGSGTAEEETAIGRLLLVDRESILVSSIEPVGGKELAVYGEGFGNGLVVIARRVMATGLIPSEDPGQG